LVGELLSYTSQYWGSANSLRDANLAGFDLALGVDWLKWAAWLNNHPRVALILRLAYISPIYQFFVLLFSQFIFAWEVRLQRVILSTQITSLITCLIAALFPAVGAYSYFSNGTTVLEMKFIPLVTDGHVKDILNLRGNIPVIPFEYLKGLITFPSFHTALGVIFIWSMWPNRILRFMSCIVNGLMIAASPLFGAHYVVDVLAGIVVALAGIRLAMIISAHLETWAAHGDALDLVPVGLAKGEIPERARRT
jgi:hypothetical protein